jgi:S1-C subfamily serine protease
MLFCALMLALGQSGQVESKDFSKESQTAALRATVKVVNHTTNREASAVIFRQESEHVFLLTAGHAAKEGDKIEIQTFTDESYPKPAKVYKSAEVLAGGTEPDVAVLRLATRDAVPGVLPLCPPAKVQDDKDFPGLCVGCTSPKAPTCLAETVRGKKSVRRPGEGPTLVWEVAAAPAKGRSGGPLVDRRGYVIGIASGANDDKGYYTHVEEIHRFLKRSALERLYEEERK